MKALTLIALSIAFSVLSARAHWTEQTINLNPGWNAVFLEVQPHPRDCDTVFASLPVESAWAWNRRFTSVQFVQDPGKMVPQQPEWLTYFPPTHSQAFLKNMHSVLGGQAYLIKLPDDAQPVEWVVKGTVAIPRREWYPDSYNLSGFYVDPSAPPTFQQYFASSGAHAGQPVYMLNSAGHWEVVSHPETQDIERGKAYWVKCKGVSDYAGPLIAEARGDSGIAFGSLLSEDKLTIRNNSASPSSVSVRRIASAAPPDMGDVPALAGEVPLYYKVVDYAGRKIDWQPVNTLTKTLSPGEKWTIQLQVKRDEMSAFTAPGGKESQYANALEITDAKGARILVPVTAERAAGLPTAGAAPANMRAGLWIGNAALSGVSDPLSWNVYSNTPGPTPATFPIRLIVHVDTNGVARLLKEVTLMLKTSPTTNYVLVTDSAKVGQYANSTDELIGRRFSSAVFGFRTPKVLNVDASGKKLSCAVTINYNDALNPFKHLYHPDHNNLNEEYTGTLGEGVESYTVSREIKMSLADTPPEGVSESGWNDTVVGGAYNEVLDGLYHFKLYVGGEFVLRYVSSVGTLE